MSFFRSIYHFLLDIVQTLLIAASIFLVVYIFLFRPFEVKGSSMYPNFQDQEFVLTSLISLKMESMKRGDVVVFVSPTDVDKDFIKRVIALPGETVSIKEGRVYVNGQQLDESAYLKSDVKTYGGAFLREGQTVTVGQGEYFVLGDNRPYSSDSREWGFVSTPKLIGKSMFIYWPVSKMQLVKNPYVN